MVSGQQVDFVSTILTLAWDLKKILIWLIFNLFFSREKHLVGIPNNFDSLSDPKSLAMIWGPRGPS